MKPANRLPSVTVKMIVEGHKFTVSLAYDGVGGPLREVAFVGRGRIGGGIDLMFHELGIKLSRAIQGRDPETGIDIAASKG